MIEENFVDKAIEFVEFMKKHHIKTFSVDLPNAKLSCIIKNGEL